MIETENFVHSVKLLTKDGVEKDSCTGFFVKSSLFLTARHLLKNYDENDQIVVEIPNDTQSPLKTAEIKYQDTHYDIVLIELLEYKSNISRGVVKEATLTSQGEYDFFGYSEGYLGIGHWYRSNSIRFIQNPTLGGEDFELYLENPSINLHGASGSPIFFNDMIVGMVTSQTAPPKVRSVLGIRNGLIEIAERFGFLENSWILDNFENKLLTVSRQFIRRNQKSRKYIPQIFIETDETKENYRFIAHPALFYSKAIETYQRISLDSMNCDLKTMGLTPLKKENLMELDKKNINSIFEVAQKNKKTIEKLSLSLQKLDSSFGTKNTNFDFTKALFGHQYGLHFPLDDISKKISTINMKASIIMADAGQGKTNFLCDFINTFLGSHNIPVLAFDASVILENNILTSFEEMRISLFGSDSNLFFQSLKDMWRYRKKQFIIIIDGINEIKDPSNFETSIYNLIERFRLFPYVRIIMSSRNELFAERFPKLSVDSDVYKFNLNSNFFSHEIVKNRLFDGYMEFFNIDINHLNPMVKQQLVDDKLLLRIFSETFGNENADTLAKLPIIEHLNLSKLFNQYLNKQQDRICTNTSDQITFDCIINVIIESMIENLTFAEVTIDKLTTEQLLFLDKVVEESIMYKLTTEVSEGIRTRRITKLSFTYDEMRDFLIANYLLEIFTENIEDAKEMIEKLTNKSSDYPVTEGIRKYLFFASKESNNHMLADFIKSNDWYSLTLLENIVMLDDSSITEDDLNIVKSMMFSFQGPYEQLFVTMVSRRIPTSNLKFDIHFLFKLLLEESDNSTSFFKKLLAPKPNKWYRDTNSLGEGLREFGDELLNEDKMSDERNKLLIPLFYLLGRNIFEFRSLSNEIEFNHPDLFNWGKIYLENI